MNTVCGCNTNNGFGVSAFALVLFILLSIIFGFSGL